jgi:Tol biopolymer transport system component
MGSITDKLCRSLGWVACLLLLGGCVPDGFRTPKPSLSNNSLNSVFPDQEPAFSEDGRLIVFSSARNGNQAVYLFDTFQERLIDLPNLNSNRIANSSPDISGDGRWIVYISNQLGKSEVFLYDRQTSRIENISGRIPGDVRNPTISGDGRFIAFESNGSGQWHVEIFDRGNPNGSQPSSQPSAEENATPSSSR